MPKIINKFGEMIGWNNVTINILGRNIEGITELDYNDSQSVEAAYGNGRYPIGYSKGNIETTAKIVLFKEEVAAIEDSLPAGGRLQDIPPFPILVKYEYNGLVRKDIIQNCIFKNNGSNPKQNEGKIEISFDLFATHIDWGIK